jgi:hypothetical protein
MRPAGAVAALDIGAVASDVLIEALHLGAEGEVVAVFERSCYVRTAGGLACVGTRFVGAGPLNLRLLLTEGQVWGDLDLRTEMKVTRTGDVLTIDGELQISTANTVIWAPPPRPVWTRVSLQHGLEKLGALVPELCPDEGLSRLVFAPGRAKPANPHATAARAQFQMLDAGLRTSLASHAMGEDVGMAATLLLGLGPGLTPSGDDLLGGVMLALTALDEFGIRDTLWNALRPELEMLTNDISAMHLAVAADGLGAEIFHTALNALLTGALPDLEAIHAIGHTSGWDTLAGMVMTLRTAV